MRKSLSAVFLISAFTLSAQLLAGDSLVYSGSFGNFGNAVSISTGRSEFIFISDASTNQVFKYSSKGIELARFGGTGFGSNGLNNPVSIDAGDGLSVYVCDNLNNRIQKLDYKLNYITAFDFNVYNQTADNSKRILYPSGVAFMSSGDLVTLIKSSEYKAAVLNSFSDITVFMGSNFGYDRIGQPAKVVRGMGLDCWILDNDNSEVSNFTTTGSYVRRLSKPSQSENVISIAYFGDNLYLLTMKSIIKYDLKGEKYSDIFPYAIDGLGKINDFALLNNSTFLILTSNSVLQYNLSNNQDQKN